MNCTFNFASNTSSLPYLAHGDWSISGIQFELRDSCYKTLPGLFSIPQKLKHNRHRQQWITSHLIRALVCKFDIIFQSSDWTVYYSLCLLYLSLITLYSPFYLKSKHRTYIRLKMDWKREKTEDTRNSAVKNKSVGMFCSPQSIASFSWEPS